MLHLAFVINYFLFYTYRYVLSYFVVLSNIILWFSVRANAIFQRRGWWAYFRKLGTEIRVRGPRLSVYRSLRRNAEIRACAKGRESGLALAFRTHRLPLTWEYPTVLYVLYVLVCLFTRRGCFWSRANPFFPIIVMRQLIRLAASLPFRLFKNGSPLSLRNINRATSMFLLN